MSSIMVRTKGRILLVEPDRLLSDNYMAALSHYGQQCEWQSTAQAAIQSVDEAKPDLIILEIQLPDHNGIELLYELRSYADLQDIPVVILSFVPESQLGLSPDARQQLGIVGYLYKPTTSLDRISQLAGEVLQ